MHSESTVDVSWEDILQFVLNYRRKGAFKDYSETEILGKLVAAYKVNGLRTVVYHGKITAIALGFPNHATKVLHLHTVLTTQRDDIAYLIHLLYLSYPDYTLTAIRRGKLVTYNTEKLTRKLWATSVKVA